MSLAEKAKTTAEITADLIVDGVEKEALKKWVLLADAEKEIQLQVEKTRKAIHTDWNRAGKEWRKMEKKLKEEIQKLHEAKEKDK